MRRRKRLSRSFSAGRSSTRFRFTSERTRGVKDQLDKLWEDVFQLAEDREERPDLTHFMGSLVLTPSPAISPGGVQDWLVIDGQQRLTTLSLLLCAVRDRLAATNPRDRDRINEQYLVNKWHPDRYTKLQPTQADRASYLACVDGTPQAGGVDRVGAAYRSFMAKLASLEDDAQVRQLERAIVSGLAMVAVTAGVGRQRVPDLRVAEQHRPQAHPGGSAQELPVHEAAEAGRDRLPVALASFAGIA